MKFAFIDKEQLCLFNDGNVEKYESDYIRRFRETSAQEQRSKSWKKHSDAMIYDDFYYSRGQSVVVDITAITPTVYGDKFLYAFSVNETSGIYYKYIDDEKNTEAHFLTANDETFLDIVTNEAGEIAGTVRRDIFTSDVAVFSKNGGDYKTVTGGDSKDENPFFYENGELWFNSYGIGRDMENEFVKYMPSEILRLNLRTMSMDTVLSDEKYSYIKPTLDKQGNLYCIKKPGEEREKRNIFLEVLMIPVRIVQGIVGFVSMFVEIFAGKPLVDKKGKTRMGGGAAKNADGKKVFIHNHLLNVEEELKRNAKTEDEGFIPRSWKLIRIRKNDDDFGLRYDPATAEELASGVGDYCLLDENEFVYTNGKRIFSLLTDGEKKERKKLVNVDFCIKLGAVQPSGRTQSDDLFDSL